MCSPLEFLLSRIIVSGCALRLFSIKIFDALASSRAGAACDGFCSLARKNIARGGSVQSGTRPTPGNILTQPEGKRHAFRTRSPNVSRRRGREQPDKPREYRGYQSLHHLKLQKYPPRSLPPSRHFLPPPPAAHAAGRRLAGGPR